MNVKYEKPKQTTLAEIKPGTTCIIHDDDICDDAVWIRTTYCKEDATVACVSLVDGYLWVFGEDTKVTVVNTKEPVTFV